MLLFFAFLCFALLLTGWIFAPTSAPISSSEHQPSRAVPEASTSPA